MLKNHFKHSVIFINLIFCVMTTKGYAISFWDTPLDINLTRIVNQDKGEGNDIQIREDKCLELLKDYNSPEDRGKIYAKIAFMYSSRGYSSPDSMRIAKTKEYCQKALEYPLDTITTCETFEFLSISQITPYYEAPEAQFINARKEATLSCLMGLKAALDNNAPKEMKSSPPGVGKYTINHDNPDYN